MKSRNTLLSLREATRIAICNILIAHFPKRGGDIAQLLQYRRERTFAHIRHEIAQHASQSSRSDTHRDLQHPDRALPQARRRYCAVASVPARANVCAHTA